MSNPIKQNPSGTRTFSGARARFYFNGNLMGYASNMSGSEEINHAPVQTVDDLAVKEHCPIGYSVSLSAALFRTIARTPGNSTDDSPGSLKEQQLFPQFNQILVVEEMDVLVEDSVTGRTLYLITGVKPAGRSWNIGAGAITQENMQFVAKKMFDEKDIV